MTNTQSQETFDQFNNWLMNMESIVDYYNIPSPFHKSADGKISVDPNRLREIQYYATGDTSMPQLPKDWNLFSEDPFYDNKRMNPNSNVQSQAAIDFDGKNAYLYENGRMVKSWPAQSGDNAHQKAYYMAAEGRGPLPRGQYTWNVNETQSYNDLPVGDKAKNWLDSVARSDFGRYVYGKFKGGDTPPKIGKWSGGTDSWGEYRGDLISNDGTTMYGRKGLMFHGGAELGSNGCIDVAGNISDVYNNIKKYDSIPVNVYYPASFDPATEQEYDNYSDYTF